MGNQLSYSEELPSNAIFTFTNINKRPNERKIRKYINTYANFDFLDPPAKTKVSSIKYKNNTLIIYVKLSKIKNGATKKDYKSFIENSNGAFEGCSSGNHCPHPNMYEKYLTISFEEKQSSKQTPKKKSVKKSKKSSKKKYKKSSKKKYKKSSKKKSKKSSKKKKTT